MSSTERCVALNADLETVGERACGLLRGSYDWITTKQICRRLGGVAAATAIRALNAAHREGLVERHVYSSNGIEWRWARTDDDRAPRFSIDWPPMFVSAWPDACRRIP